jgi:lauroyl/myristoyl acyltransferase
MAARPDKTTPAILSLHDVAVLVKLPVSTAIAWCLPEHWWGIATDRVADLMTAVRRADDIRERRALEALVEGHPVAQSPERILGSYAANLRRDQLHYMRSYTARGWHPRIDLVGREHLEAALARGRGAILWVAPFVFSSLVTKMALHEAGFAVSHLSRVGHGYSRSRFGTRVLNPVRTRIEDPYLAERVVIGADGSVSGPLKHLTQRLNANRIVSITVGAAGAKRYRCRCLNSSLELATGAPNLMVRTGAALLPVFTIRTAQQRFLTTIEAPLQAPPRIARGEALEAVARSCAERLEPYVVSWPDQFCWRTDIGRSMTVAAPTEVEQR